jgi:hypothetical protein
MHNAFHGAQCERVLNDWECRARGPIEAGEAMLAQMDKTLAAQRELFNASWLLVQEILRDHEDKSALVNDLTVKKLRVVRDNAENRGYWHGS